MVPEPAVTPSLISSPPSLVIPRGKYRKLSSGSPTKLPFLKGRLMPWVALKTKMTQHGIKRYVRTSITNLILRCPVGKRANRDQYCIALANEVVKVQIHLPLMVHPHAHRSCCTHEAASPSTAAWGTAVWAIQVPILLRFALSA